MGTAYPLISVFPEGYIVLTRITGLCYEYCLFLFDIQTLHLHLNLDLPQIADMR